MSIHRFQNEGWRVPNRYVGAPYSATANPRSFSFASIRTMTRTVNWRNAELNNKRQLGGLIGRHEGLGQDLIQTEPRYMAPEAEYD